MLPTVQGGSIFQCNNPFVGQHKLTFWVVLSCGQVLSITVCKCCASDKNDKIVVCLLELLACRELQLFFSFAESLLSILVDGRPTATLICVRNSSFILI